LNKKYIIDKWRKIKHSVEQNYQSKWRGSFVCVICRFPQFSIPKSLFTFYPFCNQIFHCGQLNMIWVKNKHHINAVKCFYCCVLSCCFVTVKRWKSSKKITGFPVSHIQFGLISKKQETTSHTRKRSCQESSVYF
jgi:hypothetical protein